MRATSLPTSPSRVSFHSIKQSSNLWQPVVSLLDQNESFYSLWCHSNQLISSLVLVLTTCVLDQTRPVNCGAQDLFVEPIRWPASLDFAWLDTLCRPVQFCCSVEAAGLDLLWGTLTYWNREVLDIFKWLKYILFIYYWLPLILCLTGIWICHRITKAECWWVVTTLICWCFWTLTLFYQVVARQTVCSNSFFLWKCSYSCAYLHLVKNKYSLKYSGWHSLVGSANSS